MERRTLDRIFSAGGFMLAIVLVIAGAVLTNNANFAKSYVSDQLRQQKISFKTADTLTPEEKQAPCLVRYAGKQLTTGKQAECYANQFIGLHVKAVAAGKTYAELGTTQSDLRAQIAAKPAPDAATLASLQKQLTDVTASRETLFKGETLRGLLLTSYGFSVFGVRAGQTASLAYLVAGLLALLSLAGLVHAARSPRKNHTPVRPPSPSYEEDRELARV